MAQEHIKIKNDPETFYYEEESTLITSGDSDNQQIVFKQVKKEDLEREPEEWCNYNPEESAINVNNFHIKNEHFGEEEIGIVKNHFLYDAEFMEYENDNFQFEKKNQSSDESKSRNSTSHKVNSSFIHIKVEIDGKVLIQCGKPGCTYRHKFKCHVKRHYISSHMTTKEAKKLFKDKSIRCPYEGCDFEHIYSSAMQRHILIKHKTDEDIEWNYCLHKDCNFKTKYKHSLVEHQKIHKVQAGKNVQRYKCEFCDMETIWKSTLTRHMLIHKTEDEVLMAKCELCTFESRHKSSISKHYQLVHKIGISPDNDSNLDSNRTQKPLLKCLHCDYQHKHKSAITKHEVIHKDLWNYCLHQDCNFKTKYKHSLTEHQKIHKVQEGKNIQRYKCEFCDMETIRKSTLTRHMLLHKTKDEVVMEKCEFCTFESRHKSSISKHYQLVHKIGISPDNISNLDPNSPQKPLLKCSYCGYQNKHKSAIEKHQIIHKDAAEIEKFKCDECPYETIHKRSLKSHKAKHLPPEMQLKCELCPFRTKYKANLQKHVIVYHKSEEETEVYSCNFCCYKTKLKKYIKKHVAKQHPNEVQSIKIETPEVDIE